MKLIWLERFRVTVGVKSAEEAELSNRDWDRLVSFPFDMLNRQLSPLSQVSLRPNTMFMNKCK